MKILLDQGVPVPLRRELAGHIVITAYERGWSRLQNGSLLQAAEEDGVDLLVTTDQQLRYQQNLGARRIAIVVLLSTDWRRIRNQVAAIRQAIDSASPGTYAEVPI